MALKVLIADDEHWVCELIQRLIDWDSLNLELAGIVENGRDAYNFIKKNDPDIVITDIRMSGLSGIELIKKALEKKDLEIKYISAGKYSVKSENENIKKADQEIKEFLVEIEKFAKKNKMEFSFKE